MAGVWHSVQQPCTYLSSRIPGKTVITRDLQQNEWWGHGLSSFWFSGRWKALSALFVEIFYLLHCHMQLSTESNTERNIFMSTWLKLCYMENWWFQEDRWAWRASGGKVVTPTLVSATESLLLSLFCVRFFVTEDFSSKMFKKQLF